MENRDSRHPAFPNPLSRGR